jgi:hypothetical protein
MTQTDILSTDVLSPRTFCPHGRFVRRTFCPPDVLSDGRSVPTDVLSDGCFVATDVLSPRTFCPYGHFVHGRFVSGRFVSGRFVWAPCFLSTSFYQCMHLSISLSLCLYMSFAVALILFNFLCIFVFVFLLIDFKKTISSAIAYYCFQDFSGLCVGLRLFLNILKSCPPVPLYPTKASYWLEWPVWS